MRPVLPTLCHFGEAFSAYVRRPDAVRRQLDVIADAGYHGVRAWDTLGYYAGGWRGREVSPIAFINDAGQTISPTPNYYEHLERFLIEHRGRGLIVHHSRGDLNSWAPSQILDHCRLVGEVQRRVGLSVIGLNEAINECNMNIADYSVTFLRRMLAAINNPSTIEALSTPPGQTEELDDLRAYAHDVFYVHGLRDHDPARMIVHLFTNGYEVAHATGTLGWQGEPTGPQIRPGPGVYGPPTNNVETLTLMCAMSLIAKQAWVYMSAEGVFWNNPIEGQPGFYEVPQVKSYLPRDIMRGRLLHGGRSEAAFTSPSGFYGDPGVTEGPARIDGAELPDGRGAWVIYGGRGRKRALARRGFEGRVINTATGSEQAIVLRPGESVEMSYEIGRLLVGRTTH